ncbi:non-ribosomal peptide synthetase [Cohnella silvisoli]|uniref:Non-ribosomal peptide synthetase n=1 Tax=Cohnella silvisoli TaxID=2873699 RepID=A0ABV1L3C7_9BACL|nr:non-ribosomal peptide synthetase [Cohnella silvisoli]MCD9026221.1 amino acid adenylation domain-containing protein [Cohnella silvisoli]
MLPPTLEERSFGRQAAAFWEKTLEGWDDEPPLQPDGFGATTWKERMEFRISERVMNAMNRYCKDREDLRTIFIFAAAAAVLLAFTRSERKLAISIPIHAREGDVTQNSRKQFVPIMIEKSEERLSLKKRLNQLLERFRESHRYADYWLSHYGGSNEPEGLKRFVFYSESIIQEREFTYPFAGANESEIWFQIEHSSDEQCTLSIVYSAGLYSTTLINSLSESIIALLGQFAECPDREETACELRSNHAIDKQLKWNHTAAPYECLQTVHEGFERKAALYPGKLAVVCGSEALTYLELSDRSSGMASRLIGEGLKPGDRIAVMLDRSKEWVVSFLAVLKAGAVYIPIDPAYPSQRIEYMLADSQATALIVSEQGGKLPLFEGLVISTNHLSYGDVESAVTALPVVKSEDLAYVLYTSGSTGDPKGVMIEHRGVSNLQSYFEGALGIGTEDRILQFASASFDASVWEMAMALLTGARLIIAIPEVIGDLERFQRLIRDQSVTVATLPPTYADQLHPERLPSLRLLITAGSDSNRELFLKWSERVNYVNAYGPTETTVCATAWNAWEEQLMSSALIPIGKPLPNTRVWIVNDELQPLPEGVPGELVVAGTGLARGYWRRQPLTEQKFTRLPLDGTLIYRTGDLAKWGDDGNLIFLGRIDNQVKIRGYRIETEEVRHTLMKHPGVRDAVVTVKPDAVGEAALIAYYVAKPDISIESSSLRKTVSECLPAYMVPTYWVELPSIPLTSNGKPDLKALPDASEWLVSKSVLDTDKPRSETEKRLAVIWHSVIGVEVLDRNDDFFKLGGHSMKAAKMTVSIHREFGVNMALEQMFRHATLAEMSTWIDECGNEGSISGILPAPKLPGYRLSPSQRRVFTIESSRPGTILYVLPFAFWIEPAPDPDKLEAAFVRLIERHEPLRTSFGWDGGKPIQIIHDSFSFYLERSMDSPDRLEELMHQVIQPFELDKPPLIRAHLTEFTDGKSLLLLHLHHIIADGLSLGILMNDLLAILEGEELPPLTLQYKDYCEWINDRTISAEHEAFWERRFNDYSSTPDLPIDVPRPTNRRSEGDTLSIQWDKTLAESIRELANRCGATVHMTMLAAYYVLLSKVTGSEEGVIGSLHAGREHPEAMAMVGMFVHTLAHRNRVNGELTFLAFVEEVKSRVLEDYEHSEYPFELLVRKLKPQRNMTRNPLFDTMFVLQNLDAPPVQTGHLKWTPLVLQEKWSRFDLVFQAWENSDGMLLWVTYSHFLFNRSTVQKIAEDFRKLLVLLAEVPERRIADVTLAVEYRSLKAPNLSFDFQF